MQTRPRRRHASFRRVFVWYCAGILGITIGISGILEILLIIWFMLEKRQATSEVMLSQETLRMAIAIPLIILIIAILFFAWLMGRKVSQ